MLSEPRLARVGLSRPLRQPLLPAATLYRRGSRSSRLRDQVTWLGRGGNGCGAAVGGSTGASSAGRWGEDALTGGVTGEEERRRLLAGATPGCELDGPQVEEENEMEAKGQRMDGLDPRYVSGEDLPHHPPPPPFEALQHGYGCGAQQSQPIRDETGDVRGWASEVREAAAQDSAATAELSRGDVGGYSGATDDWSDRAAAAAEPFESPAGGGAGGAGGDRQGEEGASAAAAAQHLQGQQNPNQIQIRLSAGQATADTLAGDAADWVGGAPGALNALAEPLTVPRAAAAAAIVAGTAATAAAQRAGEVASEVAGRAMTELSALAAAVRGGSAAAAEKAVAAAERQRAGGAADGGGGGGARDFGHVASSSGDTRSGSGISEMVEVKGKKPSVAVRCALGVASAMDVVEDGVLGAAAKAASAVGGAFSRVTEAAAGKIREVRRKAAIFKQTYQILTTAQDLKDDAEAAAAAAAKRAAEHAAATVPEHLVTAADAAADAAVDAAATVAAKAAYAGMAAAGAAYSAAAAGADAVSRVASDATAAASEMAAAAALHAEEAVAVTEERVLEGAERARQERRRAAHGGVAGGAVEGAEGEEGVAVSSSGGASGSQGRAARGFFNVGRGGGGGSGSESEGDRSEGGYRSGGEV